MVLAYVDESYLRVIDYFTGVLYHSHSVALRLANHFKYFQLAVTHCIQLDLVAHLFVTVLYHDGQL